MHHMSFVRLSIEKKLSNVSNKSNYLNNIDKFIEQFYSWTPDMSVIHPHPVLAKLFSSIGFVNDRFNINIDLMCYHCYHSSIYRCSNCKKAIYCSKQCQLLNWKIHKKYCEKN